jgi:CRISPR-associated protein Cmr6
MPQTARDQLQQINLSQAEHAGLLYQRYLPSLDDKKTEFKTQLLPVMQKLLVKMNPKALYEAAFRRYTDVLKTNPAIELRSSKCNGRLVIGLGNSSPIETGLTLHHTYGTPFLPGSALKGLASHYCHQVWGAQDPAFKIGGDHHRVLFGSTEESGSLIFHDAWITPDSLRTALQPDIMTVHHRDYYGGKNTAPTDFDEPNPIPFVSLTGTFQLAISCLVADEKASNWTHLGMELLSAALKDWGIGGKTSSGYGRMIKV